MSIERKETVKAGQPQPQLKFRIDRFDERSGLEKLAVVELDRK
jgi:hypothetical protein